MSTKLTDAEFRTLNEAIEDSYPTKESDDIYLVVEAILTARFTRIESLLDEWDRLSKGESPTTASIRAALHDEETSA
jgi:hypothetical protein